MRHGVYAHISSPSSKMTIFCGLLYRALTRLSVEAEPELARVIPLFSCLKFFFSAKLYIFYSSALDDFTLSAKSPLYYDSISIFSDLT